jgi:(p)ppGpp synthase/HD superfamily hydrolase
MPELVNYPQDPSELSLPFLSIEDLEARLREDRLWGDLPFRAMERAVKSHGQKTRDSGQPYLDEHIFPVTADVLDYLQQKGRSRHKQQVAAIGTILHDTVEDDPNFDLRQCEQDFSLEVSRLIYPLTKYGINKDIYYKKLDNAPREAQYIKLFDRINNLRCSIVLATKMPQKLTDYTAETQAHYLPLADQLFDKTIYEKMRNLVGLGYVALSKVKEQ